MRYVGRFYAFCALSLLVLPGVAYGQAGGQPDPDSPAGVEYQLPLEQARKKAGSGARDDASRGKRVDRKAQGPLFGTGIVATRREQDPGRGASQRDSGSTDGRRGAGEGGAGKAGGGQDGRARGEARRSSDSASGAPTVSRSTLAAPDDEGGSTGLWTAGIMLMVLLAGGLLGLVLRRGLRQSSD